jgi:hypothetical protein
MLLLLLLLLLLLAPSSHRPAAEQTPINDNAHTCTHLFSTNTARVSFDTRMWEKCTFRILYLN